MRKLSTTLAALICALVLATSAATAASPGTAVLADCNAHAKLTRTFPEAALRSALATMPADMKEYTNCYDVIQSALLGKVSGSHPASGTSSGSSGSSFLPAWLIVVLVLLALGAVTLGAVSVRRRR
jgi:hypothetical protein